MRKAEARAKRAAAEGTAPRDIFADAEPTQLGDQSSVSSMKAAEFIRRMNTARSGVSIGSRAGKSMDDFHDVSSLDWSHGVIDDLPVEPAG